MAQTLRVDIVGDASGYRRALNQATSGTKAFGSELGRFVKTAALVTGGAGIAGMAIVLRAGQKEWMEHAKVAAQTAQVLKTTGQAAGVTQKQVEDLATSILMKTGIDDEAVQSSENLLLSFTRVRNEAGKGNDIFNRATKVIQDYSVRTGKSATQATMLFGKALNEVAQGQIPTSIRGLGKLSDAQVKQMKAMVASGDVAGAQGVILKMLEQRYGGAAEAAGKTLPGKINILRESFKNFSAELFQSVVPALTRLTDWATKNMPQIEAIAKRVFAAVGQAIQVGLQVGMRIFNDLKTAGEALVEAWKSLPGPAKIAVGALAGLTAGMLALDAAMDANPVGVVVIALAALAAGIVEAVKHWDAITAAYGRFAAAHPQVQQALDTIRNIFQSTVTFVLGIWSRFGTQITAVAVAAFNFLKTTIQNVLNVIRGIVNIFGGLLHGDWSRVWTGIQQIFGAITSQIVAAVKAWGTLLVNALIVAGKLMIEALSAPWNAIKTLAVNVFNSVVSTIRGIVSQAVSAATAVGQGILKGVSDGLTGLVKMVQGWFQTLWGWIKGAAGSAYAFARAIGSQLIDGVISGITSAAGRLWGKIKDIGNGIKSAFTSVLHIGSPSKLMADQVGRPIIEGIAKGMTDASRILGPAITKAIIGALTQAKGAIPKGLSSVGQMIVAAARKWGVDARAALAVAMTEGGLKFGAVGDSGHAFGPFQLNNAGGVVSGMDANKAAAFANSLQGITFALKSMAAAGAAGKTGFDAIQAIVRGFERPADPAGEIQKALTFYKQLPGAAAAAIKDGAPKVLQAHKDVMTSVTNAIALFVGRYGTMIGLSNAKAIALGVVQGKPGVTAATIKTMTESAIAAGQAAGTAFGSLADRALAAFDAKVAAWVPPQQKILDKMQLQDQLKGIGAALDEAAATAQGGGAALAKSLEASVGGPVESAMASALSRIAGAKTTAALNQVSQTAQTQMTQAITNATAAASTAAQTAVDQAQAALQAAQAGGDPDAIAAAQQALDTAVQNQNALNEAIRGAIETGTGILVTAETNRHNQIAATQRAGLQQQLIELGNYLAKHPAEWAKMGGEVQKLLTGFNIKLSAAGKDWAEKFAAGIRAGIPAAVQAARDLAAAVAAVIPHSPAKEGPLAFDIKKAGQSWSSDFGIGVRSGFSTFGKALAAEMPAAGGAIGMAGGGLVVNVYNEGSVISEQELQTSIYRALARRSGNNVTLGFR